MRLSAATAVLMMLLAVPAVAGTVTLVSPGGNETVDGGLRIVLDSHGAFGSAAAPANNAWFNPPGSIGAAGTTYESGLFLSIAGGSRGFLSEGYIGTSGGRSAGTFTQQSDTSATSTFSYGGLGFTLEQKIVDRLDAVGTKVGSSLVQKYSITNSTSSAIDFTLTRYLDGDLYYSGSYSNDWGGASTLEKSMNQQLFEFDSGDDPSNPTTLVGIRALGGSLPDDYFEIDSFSGLLNRITSGTALDNSIAGDGGDSDLVTDSPYDITLALNRLFSLSPSETRTLTNVTDFGLGLLTETAVSTITPQPHTVARWPEGLAQENAQYSLAFTDGQELVLTLKVHLAGDDPGQALRDIWENGIETAWSGQYEVVDGIFSYPIVVDVQWVDDPELADISVNVHQGSGAVNSLNFYTDNPSGWGYAYQGIIAAHEAGHWMGLLDEYVDRDGDGVNDPVWWPLYDDPDAMLDEFVLGLDALYDSQGNLLPNWAEILAAFQFDDEGLMGRNGSMRDRYYEILLDWLSGESGRSGLVLAQAPTFQIRTPLAGAPDDVLSSVAVPLPTPLAACIALLGLLGLGRVVRARVRERGAPRERR